MKILHISSMAGVAEILSHELGDSLVLQHKNLDRYGFGDFYKETFYFNDWNDLIDHAKFIQDDYDRIVVHDFIECFDEFPKEKSIMFFHGSKLRSLGRYDKVAFLSTPDLLEYCPNGIVIEVPIDLKHFIRTPVMSINYKKYACFNRGYNKDIIMNKIREKYPVYYYDTSKQWVSYSEMPEMLSHIENYIEAKYTYDKPPKLLPSTQWSCTALQAKACGCTVMHLDGTLLPKELLKQHDSKVVARKFKRCLEVLN